MLQRDFTVRIESKAALTADDIRVSNGDLTSVTPVSGTDSYDVRVSTKSRKAAVAVSTIASAAVAASTINVDVNTNTPQVRPSLQVWGYQAVAAFCRYDVTEASTPRLMAACETGCTVCSLLLRGSASAFV